jgi:hypothetical protein
MLDESRKEKVTSLNTLVATTMLPKGNRITSSEVHTLAWTYLKFSNAASFSLCQQLKLHVGDCENGKEGQFTDFVQGLLRELSLFVPLDSLSDVMFLHDEPQHFAFESKRAAIFDQSDLINSEDEKTRQQLIEFLSNSVVCGDMSKCTHIRAQKKLADTFRSRGLCFLSHNIRLKQATYSRALTKFKRELSIFGNEYGGEGYDNPAPVFTNAEWTIFGKDFLSEHWQKASLEKWVLNMENWRNGFIEIFPELYAFKGDFKGDASPFYEVKLHLNPKVQELADGLLRRLTEGQKYLTGSMDLDERWEYHCQNFNADPVLFLNGEPFTCFLAFWRCLAEMLADDSPWEEVVSFIRTQTGDSSTLEESDEFDLREEVGVVIHRIGILILSPVYPW